MSIWNDRRSIPVGGLLASWRAKRFGASFGFIKPNGFIRSLAMVALSGLGLSPSVAQTNRSSLAEQADGKSARWTHVLENRHIGESSGLAMSRRDRSLLWTHNDSGDAARLFAIDRQGRHRAEVLIDDAINQDWEALASMVLDGKPQLIVGDVGDNARRRDHVVCYRIDEPVLGQQPTTSVVHAKVNQTWRIKFPDGPIDCEAIAVDEREGRLLLAGKVFGLPAPIYSVPLVGPAGNPDSANQDSQIVTATPLGNVIAPLITGMDIDHRDGRIVFCSYAIAWIYQPIALSDGSARCDWNATWNQTPQTLAVTELRQGEAVCFDTDGDAIWLTSEKKPTPLLRLATPPLKPSPPALAP